MARRAIKDVYRAQEAMEDSEFEDAADLVGILGRMMKRKSWEGTPRVGGASPAPSGPGVAHAGGSDSQGHGNGAPVPPTPALAQQSPQTSRRAGEGRPIPNSPAQRSRSSSTSKAGQRKSSVGGTQEGATRMESYRTSGGSHENTPRVGGGSQDTTPRARHFSVESGGSTTPRAPQVGGRSPATPSTMRTVQYQPGSGGSNKGKSPIVGNSTPVSPSAAAALASDAIRASPTLRRSPPLRASPPQERTR